VRPFKRRKRGGVYAVFEAAEAHLLVNLLGQLVELLRDRNGEDESAPDPLFAQLGMGGSHVPPDDPVLQRLLPDGYTDDLDASGDFRRYTERALSETKVANARTVIASLVEGGLDPADVEANDAKVEVELDAAAVQAWLRSLTDIRLSVAVRLGIESDEDLVAVADSDDETVVVMSDIYDWLGYVQETLVQSLG